MENLQIIGHIGQNAETKSTENGTEFTRFTVACYSSYKKQSGEKVEITNWYNVTTRKTKIAQFLKKGTKVFISGNLRVSLYDDKNGEKQISRDVAAEKIELLSKKETEAETAE